MPKLITDHPLPLFRSLPRYRRSEELADRMLQKGRAEMLAGEFEALLFTGFRISQVRIALASNS